MKSSQNPTDLSIIFAVSRSGIFFSPAEGQGGIGGRAEMKKLGMQQMLDWTTG